MPGRSIPNGSERFKSTTSSKVKDAKALLTFRREPMERAWGALDADWDALQERMREVGIVGQPATNLEGLLTLNLGGSIMIITRCVLHKSRKDERCDARLSDFISKVWDNRLPRDTDGSIVIDESPACMKHAIYTLLKESSSTGMAGLSFNDGWPWDENAYMPHAHRLLGVGMALIGNSKVMEPEEVGPLTTPLREWCPGKPVKMELLYRASRDGWSSQDVRSRCGDDSPSTITLVRVSNIDPESKDSVVGGFSSVPWSFGTNSSKKAMSSPGAFLFMLKDGTSHASTTFQPRKWGVRPGKEPNAVSLDSGLGISFGPYNLYDLGVSTSSATGTHHIFAARTTYDIPPESAFLRLTGRPVVDMEVFRVCAAGTIDASPPPWKTDSPKPSTSKTGLIDLPASDTVAMSAESFNDDIRSFGASIADSLMEERVALHQAHVELAQANAEAAASVKALVALYGPHVAANKEGAAAVVDLSVRGTRMTTLRSTLRACPDSAFAARFDEDKWPATEKDVDAHGRRVIDDCSPSVFSKILDVLRVRKCMGWGTDETSGEDVRVVVKADDREALEEFVHMYFTDHESFIMDLIQTP